MAVFWFFRQVHSFGLDRVQVQVTTATPTAALLASAEPRGPRLGREWRSKQKCRQPDSEDLSHLGLVHWHQQTTIEDRTKPTLAVTHRSITRACGLVLMDSSLATSQSNRTAPCKPS